MPLQTSLDRADRIEAVFQRKAKFQDEQLQAYAARSGNLYGGYDDLNGRPLELSEAELREQAEAEVAAQDAFRATPRGRFVTALTELTACGAPEADDLYGYYSRSIRDDRKPLDTVAVGRCLSILVPLTTMSAGREATAALADLLASEAPQVVRVAA